MARLNTPFHRSGTVPEDTGPGTIYPWVLDINTADGYRQFDVVMANWFRIIEWRLTGTMVDTDNPGDIDNVDETIPIAGPTIAGEWDFASDNAVDDPPSPPPFNTSMGLAAFVGASINIARLDFADQFAISLGQFPVAVPSLTFEASGPVSGVLVVANAGGFDVGELTFRVKGWRGQAWHELKVTLNSGIETAEVDLIFTGTVSLGYADANDIRVWEEDGSAALDPIHAHVEP